MIAYPPVSDMLVTVKSREVQRALQAEAGQDRTSATRHFLAAAHLEFVLAEDYSQAGQNDLADRSRISAASCLWRAGEVDRARELFQEMVRENPARRDEVDSVVAELESASS
jgi:pentatricopeptide repeat protein